MEFIVFVNRGTQDCRAVVEWLKQEMPEAKIISLCLENDPYIDMNIINQMCSEYQMELVIIPFDASLIATKNQNIELAWQFNRHFKALQFQRSKSIYTPDDYMYEYVVTSLRGTAKNKELIGILNDYLTEHAYDTWKKFQGRSFIVFPFEHLENDGDPISFLPVDEV